MSGEKSKSKLDWLINGANWTAVVVVGFATIALISVVYKLINMESSNTAPKEIIVKYEIVVDTIALKKVKDPTILKTVSNIDENNKKILAEINASVDAQYKRMESILEVQEDRSKMFSYGAGFLAILVAIATFFGFKSINEMKKGTIDTAEYEAQKIAEVKAKEIAESISKQEISKQTETIKIELEEELKQLLLAENKIVVAEELKTKTQNIANLHTQVSDLLSRLETFSNVEDEKSKTGINREDLHSKNSDDDDDDVEFKLN